MPLRPGFTVDQFRNRGDRFLPGLLGVEILSLTENAIAMELKLREAVLAPNGFLHAATIIALADTAAGYGCVAHLPDGAINFTTIELKSNFLGTAKEGVIRTECLADHLGRTTHVWSATVFGPSGKKLALFRCTQMILF